MGLDLVDLDLFLGLRSSRSRCIGVPRMRPRMMPHAPNLTHETHEGSCGKPPDAWSCLASLPVLVLHLLYVVPLLVVVVSVRDSSTSIVVLVYRIYDTDE